MRHPESCSLTFHQYVKTGLGLEAKVWDLGWGTSDLRLSFSSYSRANEKLKPVPTVL